MKPEQAEEFIDALGQIADGVIRLAGWAPSAGVPIPLEGRRAIVAANPDKTTRVLAETLGVSHATIANDRRRLVKGGKGFTRPGVSTWSRRVQTVSAKVPMGDLTDDEVSELHGAATFLRDYCAGELINREGEGRCASR